MTLQFDIDAGASFYSFNFINHKNIQE